MDLLYAKFFADSYKSSFLYNSSFTFVSLEENIEFGYVVIGLVSKEQLEIDKGGEFFNLLVDRGRFESYLDKLILVDYILAFE